MVTSMARKFLRLPIRSIRCEDRRSSLAVRNNWGGDRVSYAGPEGRLRTLPVEWTDVIEPELVVTVGAGRAFFRADRLRELRKLIDECRRQQEAPSC